MVTSPTPPDRSLVPAWALRRDTGLRLTGAWPLLERKAELGARGQADSASALAGLDRGWLLGVWGAPRSQPLTPGRCRGPAQVPSPVPPGCRGAPIARPSKAEGFIAQLPPGGSTRDYLSPQKLGASGARLAHQSLPQLAERLSAQQRPNPWRRGAAAPSQCPSLAGGGGRHHGGEDPSPVPRSLACRTCPARPCGADVGSSGACLVAPGCPEVGAVGPGRCPCPGLGLGVGPQGRWMLLHDAAELPGNPAGGAVSPCTAGAKGVGRDAAGRGPRVRSVRAQR